MEKSVVVRYRELQRKLGEKCPDALEEAEKLSLRIADPSTADAGEIWRCLYGIPLYANMQVEAAREKKKLLVPYMGDVKEWGEEAGAIRFSKVGNGYSPESYKALTAKAKEIRKKTNIAMHRLFAIQGGAEAICKRARASKAPFADMGHLIPLNDVTFEQLVYQVTKLKKELGFGWGTTTTLHFLTDLGSACKPDIHLFRTVQYLQEVPDSKRKKTPTGLEPFRVVMYVLELIKALDGSVARKRLRFMDNVLMEISRQKII